MVLLDSLWSAAYSLMHLSGPVYLRHTQDHLTRPGHHPLQSRHSKVCLDNEREETWYSDVSDRSTHIFRLLNNISDTEDHHILHL